MKIGLNMVTKTVIQFLPGVMLSGYKTKSFSLTKTQDVVFALTLYCHQMYQQYYKKKFQQQFVAWPVWHFTPIP